MALDFVILGNDGAPTREVPIGVGHHHEILSVGLRGASPLLSRIANYYADATYEASELAGLIRELEAVRSSITSERARATVQAIISLCGEAARHGTNIEVLAD